MRVKLTRQQMDWMLANLRFKELTHDQQNELFASIPDSEKDVVWDCPSFASTLVRDEFQLFFNEQKRLIEEMNQGIVSGQLKLDILGSKVN
jgi:hypothetical protein